jgi:hypothetical protein
MVLRLARLLIPAAVAALAWVGLCRAIGLSTALTVAGAILGGGGSVLSLAVCTVGAGQREPIEPSSRPRAVRTVKAEPQKRFGRDENRTRSGDRVA